MTQSFALEDFYTMPPAARQEILLDAVFVQHAWHYARNPAYRRHCDSRGLGERIGAADLARALRPTAQTFKSYIGVLGTPFPQDRPAEFLRWLADQLSVDLPGAVYGRLRPRYRSLEALLSHLETLFADAGWRIATSSGTSGRATIMVRDHATFELALDSFFLGIRHAWGIDTAYRLIFVMPEQTRIAMAQAARFGTEKLGYVERGLVNYTIPFAADPDALRIRSARTLRPGLRGRFEQRVAAPFMNWMGEHYVLPRSVQATVDLLQRSAAAGEKLMLFGGPIQLHAVALELRRQAGGNGPALQLPPGSLIGTGGGMKEAYQYPAAQIRRDIAAAIHSAGRPIPVRDVYGMAEANWAAFECPAGNHHLPPWVYAATLDEKDAIAASPDTRGMLAFFDPFGGGRLFPPFFKTTDQVHLVGGGSFFDPARCCPCGEQTAYIVADTIRRVDLQDEAGCAGQV